jgi:hypothetical protein
MGVRLRRIVQQPTNFKRATGTFKIVYPTGIDKYLTFAGAILNRPPTHKSKKKQPDDSTFRRVTLG